MVKTKEFKLDQFAEFVYKRLCEYDVKKGIGEPKRFWNTYNWLLTEESDQSRKLGFPVQGYVGDIPEKMLKARLNFQKEWKTADAEARLALAEFIVQDWGGVRTNKNFDALIDQEKLEKLAVKCESRLASFTKVLAFAYPEKYYIYDARVAFAVIYLWYEWAGKSYCPFRMAPSRNTLIDDHLGALNRRKLGERVPNRTYAAFYKDKYCKLIKAVAEKYPEYHQAKTNQKLFPHKVEMALFSLLETITAEMDGKR